MCEKIALPNMAIRSTYTHKYKKLFFNFFFCLAVDEELFEDNPIEYIRRDLEGSGIVIYIYMYIH